MFFHLLYASLDRGNANLAAEPDARADLSVALADQRLAALSREPLAGGCGLNSHGTPFQACLLVFYGGRRDNGARRSTCLVNPLQPQSTARTQASITPLHQKDYVNLYDHAEKAPEPIQSRQREL
ncbi:hypothetical protein [Pseudomonas veronii]|uniref:hypothetical protein n=1 Tax=Pseudomonas veronii TaxID=76761 RepID=UPI0028F720DF|nr:hypothetical protein [Pseudomonas veronii]